MRNTLLIFFLLVYGISFSQEKTVSFPEIEDSIYTDADVAANFPGGKAAILNFIAENLHYPFEDVEGKCYLRFIVDKEGTISNVKILRGIPDCPQCDKEVIRLIQSMPKWIPATIQGKPVASYVNFPITICL